MQTYDIVMLLVLAGATLFGFWKGMAWQIASLASLVVSYFAALRFSAQLAPYFGQQAPLNRFAAMLAIYVAVSFVIWMLFRLVSELIDKVKLESFDRQLGGIIGFTKGVLLCVAITFFAVTLLPQQQGEAIVASRAGHTIVVLLHRAHDIVPQELDQQIAPYLQKIEERISGNSPPQGQNLQNIWPQGAAQQPQPPASPAWPQQGQTPWPSSPGQSTWPGPAERQTQSGWPSDNRQAPSQTDPYRTINTSAAREAYPTTPREPNPFPGDQR
jgi:membrane protein required for colicin V production